MIIKLLITIIVIIIIMMMIIIIILIIIIIMIIIILLLLLIIIIFKLLTFSKCFTCILIATFCFEMWNIFEYALRYFIIDNNYKLLITCLFK